MSRVGDAHRVGFAALAVAALLCGRASAGEVVEPWEDGTTPHKRFAVDEAGHRDGRYIEYQRDGRTVAIDANYRHDALDGAYAESYESGRPKTRATYRAGKREGHFEAFSPEGDAIESSNYAGGELDGKRQISRAKRLVVTQTWKAGVLATLDGAIAFPRAKDEVRRTIEKILAGELPVADPASKSRPKAGGKAGSPSATDSPELAAAPADLDTLRDQALRRMRAYRYVCEVPWEDLVAGEAESRSAQYASFIVARLGKIMHEPTNPGLPDDVYRIAARAASECNQCGPASASGSNGATPVDGYMDDSDPTNIARLGHRRSLLSLEIRTTGFGFSDSGDQRFSAMSKTDSGRAQPPDIPFVVYPARGWTPSDMFSSHHAWSVGIDPVAAQRIDAANITARVRRLSADFVPSDEDLPIELMPFDKSSRKGGRPTLIFRPTGIEVSDGAAYLAEISAVDPKTRKPVVLLRWVAGFYDEKPAADGPAAGPRITR
jgi:hypothetical protein